MPITYEVDAERRRITTHCVGQVTLDEILAHFRALRDDATLPSPLSLLLDLTELTSLAEGGQLITVAAQVRQAEESMTWGACAIAARDDATFGMGRMFERLVERSFERTRVFRDVAEAQAWLASLH